MATAGFKVDVWNFPACACYSNYAEKIYNRKRKYGRLYGKLYYMNSDLYATKSQNPIFSTVIIHARRRTVHRHSVNGPSGASKRVVFQNTGIFCMYSTLVHAILFKGQIKCYRDKDRCLTSSPHHNSRYFVNTPLVIYIIQIPTSRQ